MSAAVLISGQMRTARECASGLVKLFPDAEFYVHAVGDGDANDGMLFKPMAMEVEDQPELPDRREYHAQIGRGCHGVRQVLAQLWGLKRVWQLYETWRMSHKWIIRLRADTLFSVPPEPESEYKDGVMVPSFCNYWGFNDRFAIMRFDYAKRYFERVFMLDEYINSGGMFHPETFLKHVLDINLIPVHPTRAVFSTIRKHGPPDGPLYFPECGDVDPNSESSMGKPNEHQH